MWFKKIHKDESGSIAIIAATSLISILALCGLVIDLGAVYIRSSSLQNAADSAVYAAAYKLPISVADDDGIAVVNSTVQTYVQRNGIGLDLIASIELGDIVGGKYTTVRVVLSDYVNYGFGPIIGLNGADVSKAAKIGIRAATSSENMLPLGTTTDQFEAAMVANDAQNVIVKYGEGDGETGFFGALDLDGVQGGGAKDFASWLAWGYDGTLSIGDGLPVETGNMTGPTTSAFETRYSHCTHVPKCTASHFDPSCDRVVVLIIYRMDGIHDIIIEGFVPFVLVGNDGGEVTASHVNVTLNSGTSEELNENNMLLGLYRAKLTE